MRQTWRSLHDLADHLKSRPMLGIELEDFLIVLKSQSISLHEIASGGSSPQGRGILGIQLESPGEILEGQVGLLIQEMGASSVQEGFRCRLQANRDRVRVNGTF